MDDPFLWMKFRTTSILGRDPDSTSQVPEDCELFERKDWTTKITYDPKTDTLTIILKTTFLLKRATRANPEPFRTMAKREALFLRRYRTFRGRWAKLKRSIFRNRSVSIELSSDSQSWATYPFEPRIADASCILRSKSYKFFIFSNEGNPRENPHIHV